MIDYVIELDDDLWIGVPPGFPYAEWDDAASWAADLAAAAVPDDVERRERFETAALGVAGVHPPGVDHVLWFAPADGSTMGIAFLTVADAEGETVDLEALARHELDTATPVQTTRHPSQVFGTVVQSATTVRLADVAGDGNGDGDAAGDGTDRPGDGAGYVSGVAGSIRTVAAARDAVFMLNAVDEDLATLGLMQPAMVDLFERIRLLDGHDEIANAVRRLTGDPRR